jgi:putative sigma-54 modulation protein
LLDGLASSRIALRSWFNNEEKIMVIDIHTNSILLTDALRDHIERRFKSTLKWADRYLTNVSVRLLDVNGPKGGVDQSCQVLIPVNRGRPVFISEIQTDIYSAVDRALERAGRTLTRRLKRRQSHKLVGSRHPEIKVQNSDNPE